MKAFATLLAYGALVASLAFGFVVLTAHASEPVAANATALLLSSLI